MPMASYAVPNFLGGEISQFAQGRFDRPEYRTSLNVCFNAFPSEMGAWVRRPGTMHAGLTRGGSRGRVWKFDFEQSKAITVEATDGWLRFRNGAVLITTGDGKTVLAVSAATPAVVQLSAAVTWATGDTVVFPAPAPAALLENRQFIATKIDGTHFSLADAVTGAGINGASLGAIAAGATVQRVQELATAYVGDLWSSIRAVQAETTAILLNGAVKPYALTVTTLPTDSASAVFALNPAIFNDGPYLDPFTNGVLATPSAKSGIVSIALSFDVYSATKAYSLGSFVTSSGVNYKSLQDQNVGNTPASSPTFWTATSASAAINDGRGFLGTDIGRSVRLLSEPVAWSAAASYGGSNFVTYNPTNEPGAATYWVSKIANTGVAPGTDLASWELLPGTAAVWTWGKITSLSNLINRALAGSVNIGDLTGSGGLGAAFDGVFVKNAAASAQKATSGGFLSGGTVLNLFSIIGKNYSGASNQKIQQATVYPATDNGIGFGSYVDRASGGSNALATTITVNLRAKASAPATSSDGTLLGTSGPLTNTASAITVVSSDQTTAWPYVWVEVIVRATIPPNGASSFYLADAVAQLSFFNPPGTGTGDGFNVEILGPPLLYTFPVQTWRLGVYSETTGWPTCGCYYEGRLWLSGAVPNRFDASVSNGISGGTINFAPTDQNGVVGGGNAISYTLNSDSVNPIYWMEPDLQGIIVGTQAGEYLIQAPTTGPLAATNIAARRVTRIGCANVEPRRTEHTSVFVQRYGQKLMEYFADVYSGKFSAPNIADKAQHITRATIAELAYQQAVTPIIWGRGADGSFFGCTYKRNALATAEGPTYNGWHRHALGSGRAVESICSGPSVGGDLDSLTMVTNDPATGTRHVEIMTDTLDELSPLTLAMFLDNAVAPTSTVSTSVASEGAPYGGLTLNGLWHLNGKTVQVFAGGLDCGDRGFGTTGFTDFVVTNGSCFVPYGDGVSAGTGRGQFTAAYVASITPFPITVGFTFTSQGQLVRPIAPPDTGARNGPGFGKIGRAHRYAMKLVNSLGVFVGADLSKPLYPVSMDQQSGQSLEPLTMFSGIAQNTLQDDYGYESALCWEVRRPYPANVVAIGPNLSTQDE